MSRFINLFFGFMEKKMMKRSYFILGVILIIVLIGGTYAFQKFNIVLSDNKITTSDVSIEFLESDKNVIDIEDAVPVSDKEGKMQDDVFDFVVTTKTNKSTNLEYVLSMEKLEPTSGYTFLDDSAVKVYLTDFNDNVIMDSIKVSDLNNYVLYSRINNHSKDNSVIKDNYRLRIWISDDVDSSSWNKDTKLEYKFKINVSGKERENLDNSGANAPRLSDNMIPVYYDSKSDVWRRADASNSDKNHKWYDYDDKMWANAVTVTSDNRSKYLSSDVGEVIPMSDINTMWVWIPRYTYTYLNTNNPEEIKIKFENGTSSSGTISCESAINQTDSSGNKISEVCTDSVNGSLKAGVSTYTHQAFWFDLDDDGAIDENEKLTGIWVGKFENSATSIPSSHYTSSSKIIIKPDVLSLRYKDVSYFFRDVRSMEEANNDYGFPQSSSTVFNWNGNLTGDTNNFDIHMAKNSEWGAVAYLSHSKYGINKEININNSHYYTGRSGGDVGGKTSVSSVYTDQTSTALHNTYGFYTYDGYLLDYNTNTKSTTRDMSKVASTTGNIYGVYDMSGGANEYVMGNMVDSSGKFYTSGAGNWSSTVPFHKYYDSYTYDTVSNSYTRGKLGEATREFLTGSLTKGWYSDLANMPRSNLAWITRGHYYVGATEAGSYFFHIGTGGYTDSTVASRSSLVFLRK